jgi:predicted HicB family RNase H-like nuclease
MKYKPRPPFVETKSRRVNLLMQPTTVTAAKAAAKSLNISFNEFVNRAVKLELKKIMNEGKEDE